MLTAEVDAIASEADRLTARKKASREVQTETLTIKATPLPSGVVKAKTGNETDSTVYTDWYKAVYMPTLTGVNSAE